MQMLYNSDNYVVVEFDASTGEHLQAGSVADTPPGTAPTRRGGYEIVDKFARKEIFIQGALAETFEQGAKALAETDPSPEQFDEFIAGFTALAHHPVTLH